MSGNEISGHLASQRQVEAEAGYRTISEFACAMLEDKHAHDEKPTNTHESTRLLSRPRLSRRFLNIGADNLH